LESPAAAFPFSADLGAVRALVTPHGFTLQNVRSDEEKPEIPDGFVSVPSCVRVSNLEVTFEGSSDGVWLEGRHRRPESWRRFTGEKPAGEELSAYDSIYYHDLYPGVDLELFVQRGSLEYDLHLAPGARLDQVVVRWRGAGPLFLDEDGWVEAQTEFGTVVQRIPATYELTPEGRRELTCRHRLLDTEHFGFELEGSTNGANAIVIDPGLMFGTYLGGVLDDQGYNLAVDGTGVFVTGWTSSADFPATPGSYDSTSDGMMDAVVAKFDLSGTQLLFATFIGGSGNDAGSDIAVDASGAIIITGWTASPDFPVTPGAYDTVYSGGGGLAADGFVAKLSGNGDQLLRATYIGGSGDDLPSSLALGAVGEVYITGGTGSSDYPTTPGVGGSTPEGGTDAFATKFDPTLSSLIFSTYLGGIDEDDGWEVVANAAGDVWVAGRTFSLNFPVTPGAYDTSYNGSFDIFIAKLDPTAAGLVWATFIGGVRRDEGNAMAVDDSGNVYVTGVTRSYDFPVTHGAFDETLNDIYDGYVAKVDATGSKLLAATYLGGTKIDYMRGIAVDANGDVYVSGLTWSDDFPMRPADFDTTFNGFTDGFISKLDGNLTRLKYSTFLGGPLDDFANHLTLGGTNLVYATGSARGLFPVTTGAYDTSWNGGTDAFLVKLETISTCPPSSISFGVGWPGTFGVPSLTAIEDPLLCGTVDVLIGNSAGVPTTGRILMGTKKIAYRTPWDGWLLLAPEFGGFCQLPPGGLQVKLPLGCQAILCGSSLFVQALELDPGASRGVSFTPGLELILGF
jgi:hypothetical protein